MNEIWPVRRQAREGGAKRRRRRGRRRRGRRERVRVIEDSRGKSSGQSLMLIAPNRHIRLLTSARVWRDDGVGDLPGPARAYRY